jgi:hypothetical protein
MAPYLGESKCSRRQKNGSAGEVLVARGSASVDSVKVTLGKKHFGGRRVGIWRGEQLATLKYYNYSTPYESKLILA